MEGMIREPGPPKRRVKTFTSIGEGFVMQPDEPTVRSDTQTFSSMRQEGAQPRAESAASKTFSSSRFEGARAAEEVQEIIEEDDGQYDSSRPYAMLRLLRLWRLISFLIIIILIVAIVLLL